MVSITMSRRSSFIAVLVALAAPDGGDAFASHARRRPRDASSSLRMASSSPSIGIFFGTSTGNTEDVADLLSAAFGDAASDPIEIDGVAGSVAEKFAGFESLVVGTPTWNTGADTERSGTGWDELYYSEMKELNIAGKKVAVFGLGDSVSYDENYADAAGELHDVFESLGCQMIGYTSQEGYQHEESKAARGDSFCGLLLDAVNEEEKTEDRVNGWVAKLLGEGISESRGEAAPVAEAPVAAAPVAEVPVAAAPVAAPSPRIEETASVIFDDHLLAEEIIAGVKKTRSGYAAHHNPRTDETMWISTDGKSSYVTTGVPGYE